MNTLLNGIAAGAAIIGVCGGASIAQQAGSPAPGNPPPPLTHVLWDNTDGTASVWNMKADGSYTSRNFGPFAGWTAVAIVDDLPGIAPAAPPPTGAKPAAASGGSGAANQPPPAGMTHLLWDNADGSASIWDLGAGTAYTAHTFGPFAGWTATGLVASPPGHVGVIWQNTSGQKSLWNLDLKSNTYKSNTLGSFAGWTVVGISSYSPPPAAPAQGGS